MNTSKLNEIATQLTALYKERAQHAMAEYCQTQDAEARRLFLTPAEGWPGKNAEDRKIAAERVFTGDEALKNIAALALAAKTTLAKVEGEIAALEAERRGLEWQIRANLVEALSGRRNGNGAVVEEGFDDAADVASDEFYFDHVPELPEEAPF